MNNNFEEIIVGIEDLFKNTGTTYRQINLEELKILEPNVKLNIKGATYYKCDSHTTPHEFMTEMKAYLRSAGVEFFSNEKVEDLEVSNQEISALKTNLKQAGIPVRI